MLHPPCKSSGLPPCDAGGFGGEAQIYDGKLSKNCSPEPENPCGTKSCLQRLTEAKNALHEMQTGSLEASVTSPSGSITRFKPTPADKSALAAYIRELEAECGPVDPCPPPSCPCDPCGGQTQQAYTGRGPLLVRF